MWKRNLLAWQRQMLLVLIAVICSVSVGLIWHRAVPTTQVNSGQVKLVTETSVPQPSAPNQPQQGFTLNIPRIKAKVTREPKLKAFEQNMLQLEQSQTNDTFSLPKEFQGKIIAQTALLPKQKVIALTFDDGPWPRTTEQVLDILKQNEIKATFFWIGNNLKSYPEIGKLVVDGGHAIGNHTWHHWYRWMDASTAAKEIEDTAELIYKTTGVTTSLFRPPGGFLHNGPAGYAKQKNYAVMMWSADSRDWFYRLAPAKILVDIVLHEAKPGGIVLMHDGGGDRSKTVKALPRIIAGLKQRGYQFVTVPELLEMKDQDLRKGLGAVSSGE